MGHFQLGNVLLFSIFILKTYVFFGGEGGLVLVGKDYSKVLWKKWERWKEFQEYSKDSGTFQ